MCVSCIDFLIEGRSMVVLALLINHTELRIEGGYLGSGCKSECSGEKCNFVRWVCVSSFIDWV